MLAKIGKVALAGGALTGGYAWANAGQQSPNLSHDPKVEVVISPEIPTIDAAATYANGGYMGAALRNAEIEYLDAENGGSTIVHYGQVLAVPVAKDQTKNQTKQ